MRATRLPFSPFLVLLLAAACATPREEGSRAPVPGEPAPALVLPITTGGDYSLADAAKERTVVVVFYRGKF